jgi:hypothetical protein
MYKYSSTTPFLVYSTTTMMILVNLFVLVDLSLAMLTEWEHEIGNASIQARK